MKTYQLSNAYLTLKCISYGATLTSLYVNDKDNKPTNVIVGFPEEDDYKNHGYCIGASIGRFAGRIGKKHFEIDGNQYTIHHDANGVHLHGGKHGFHKRDWKFESQTEESITFSLLSEHLDEGYPGNVKVSVTYSLEKNSLHIIYKATTDKKTVLNLTNHAYYNLNGEGDILTHELELNSNQFLEIDQHQLATGTLLDVENTPFDFTKPCVIGQQKGFKGIDDCFKLNGNVAATLYNPSNGIAMKVLTNQPGVVIFTPDDIGDNTYTDGQAYGNYSSICFETQNFPNCQSQ